MNCSGERSEDHPRFSEMFREIPIDGIVFITIHILCPTNTHHHFSMRTYPSHCQTQRNYTPIPPPQNPTNLLQPPRILLPDTINRSNKRSNRTEKQPPQQETNGQTQKRCLVNSPYDSLSCDSCSLRGSVGCRVQYDIG